MWKMKDKRFAYKFCISTFMFRKIIAIQTYNNFTNEISALFNVTYEFTTERFVTLNPCYKS
ncbi:hypothetical protein BACI9J_10001 [Bacillus altitudinis]|nr:hypothetical protein BACI9J_10001 [Bacillus altitudinis]